MRKVALFFFTMTLLLATQVDATTPLEQVQEQIQLRHYEQAISLLQGLIRQEPQNPRYHLLLGNLYYQLYSFSNAANEFLAILSTNPNNVEARYNLGVCYKEMGKTAEAIKEFKKILEVNPNLIPAREYMAKLYALSGNYFAAIEEYKLLQKLQPNSTNLIALANLYLLAKDDRLALKTLTDFLKINPNSPEGWALLAEVHLKKNNLQAALDASQKAVRLNPNHAPYLLTQAKISLAINTWDSLTLAITDSKKASLLEPNNGEANRLLIEANEKLAARTQRLHVFISGSIIFALILISVYFWRMGGRKEATRTQMVEGWTQHLETLNDLKELAEYLLAYFSELFNLPKGMFFLSNREKSDMKSIFTNYTAVLMDTIRVNPEYQEKWLRIYRGRPMTSVQAYKSSFFLDSFPNIKELFEKQDIRLFIPFQEKGKLVGLLALGGVTKSAFRDLLSKIRPKVEIANSLAQRAALSIERLTLYELSVVDEQTKLHNLRYFREVLLEELKRVEQYAQPCSLLMIDIDNFKLLNDTYGHQQGDSVLKELAQLLKENVRDGMDSVARYGGEEFSVILPATQVPRAVETAERIRASVYNHTFAGLPPGSHVSISIGVASYPDHADSDWLLIKEADQALYESKKKGRNQVSVSTKNAAKVPNPKTQTS